MSRVIEYHPPFRAQIEYSILKLYDSIAKHIFPRGYGLIHKLLRPFLGSDNSVTIAIFQKSKLRIYISDAYWRKLLFGRYNNYEPELEKVFTTVLTGDPNECFVDAGSNIGFWAVFCSELTQRPECVIAVEANPDIYPKLVANWETNGKRFRPINCALGGSVGTLQFYIDPKHHDRSYAAGAGVGNLDIGTCYVKDVESLTLSAVLSRIRDLGTINKLVLKLDIEGMETAVIQNSMELFAKIPTAIIYEDHGSDKKSTVTRFLIDTAEFSIYFCADEGLLPVSSLDQMTALKKIPTKGYNFVATNDEDLKLKINSITVPKTR